MSTVPWLKAVVPAVFAAVILVSPAAALELKPFKDVLFAYPAILSQADNGDRRTVDYQELRDINDRDEIPERRVKRRYVDLAPKREQATETIRAGDRKIDIGRVGTAKNARFAVIFIHGRGGDRRLALNDYSFGGNFNRIKNLSVENGGVFIAPSVRRFDQSGIDDVAAVIAYLKQESPDARIVVACASMGSQICWGIARQESQSALTGMMIMGGIADPDFARTPAGKRKLPLFISHGSRDSVYAAGDAERLYASLHGKGYPTRFVLFESGSHGTPIRMTDWRESLNWIFSR